MFTPPPVRVLVSMVAPILSCLLVSCVSLEFDRMTGTTFPAQHLVNGQPVTLSSIFDDAGIKLSVEEDDTGIQPLNIAEDDCISDAELATVENGHLTASFAYSLSKPIEAKLRAHGVIP